MLFTIPPRSEPAQVTPPAAAAVPDVPRDRPRLRTTPPLRDFPRFPVTAGVALAAVAATVAWWAGWDPDSLLMDARVWDGQFWRLARSPRRHVNLSHRACNRYWRWTFGTVVEATLGHRAAAGVILLLAIGSEAGGYALSGPGVGLSGVGYGLFALLLVLGRRDPRFAGAIDGRTVTLFLGWFALCWVLTEAGAWRVGNAAHAAGATLGVFLGLALSTRGRWRAASISLLSVVVVLALAGGAARTPEAAELGYLGYHDLEAGRDWRAAERYERALGREPGRADWWFNLGVARQRLGRPEAAVEAYRRAAELRPQEHAFRQALLEARADLGYRRHLAGDLEGAVGLYLEVVAADPGQAHCWYNLGVAYQALGRADPAREAYQRAVELAPSDEQFRAALRTLSGPGGEP